mgnify:CR=1 FL=1
MVQELTPYPIGEEEYYLRIEEEPIVTIISQSIVEEAQRITKALKIKVLEEKKPEIRDKLDKDGRLKKIPKFTKRKPCCIALDTGFTAPPLELTGGKLLVIIRSHVMYGCKSKHIPLSDSVGIIKFIQEDENLGTPLSKIIERKFIKELLELKSQGKVDLDLIILDGELFPRIPPRFSTRLARRKAASLTAKLYDKIISLTNDILELADKTDTALVGVVKRAYGRDIPIMLNMLDLLFINDKAIATYILKQGEWIDIGTYADIAYYLHRVLEENTLPKRIRISLNERMSWIIGVIDETTHAASIRVAIYKSTTPTYFMLATKVEIWPSNDLLCEDIISYLSSITGANGVPHPIDLVDSMCRIKKDTLYLAQQQLFKELTAILDDPKLAMSIAGLTNPEKMHKVGFK